MKRFRLLMSVLFIGVNAAKLPDYMKKCRKGPDGTTCLIDNALAAVSVLANDGEPKFKLQSLTPLHVDKIILQASPQLKIVLNNVDFSGFETIEITDGHINSTELHFKSHMNRMEMVGKYDITGRILFLPIQGKGDINFTMVDFGIVYKTKLLTEERKGKTYLKVTNDENTKVNLINPKRIYFHFKNLFNGNERLGHEMNRFLNDNWKDVFEEVKESVEQTTAYSIVNYFINGYLHFIPVNELFDS